MGTRSIGAGRNHTCKGSFVSQVNSTFLVMYCYNRKDNLLAKDSKLAGIATKAESIRVCIKSVLSL